MGRAGRRFLATVGAVSIVLLALVVYAADDTILMYLPAIVKAQTGAVNPVGTWSGTGVSGAHSGDGTNDQRCAVPSITLTISGTAVDGLYTVSYVIPGFCMGTWNGYMAPAVLVGNRLLFNAIHFSDIGSSGSTKRMAMDLHGEVVITGNTASLVIQNNGSSAVTATTTEEAIAWIIGGQLTRQ
ncbi:hypothetical protein [Desulfovibrio sp. TomC]|uniref:hypothetical protein n=1 Tax=Desulfovibrio sp. TomC TaxID=1562888 RepID=UPI0012E1DA3A|nr:hypothetical protein [Desulfovibrio sp. TomC]